MSKSEEYRMHATRCLLLAEESANSTTRLPFMEMAQAWLRLADQAEKNGLYETPPAETRRSA